MSAVRLLVRRDRGRKGSAVPPGESRERRRDSPGRLSAASGERGVTVVELLTVLIIMGTVLGALTTLFVRGMKAEVEADKRYRAQDQARLAVDRMRREIHCASGIANTASSVTVTLPGHCPNAVGGNLTTVVYNFHSVGSSRYRLQRAVNGGAAVAIADYITDQNAFAYTEPSPSTLGKLSVDFRVNVKPNEGWATWRLQTDIVLRNTLRA